MLAAMMREKGRLTVLSLEWEAEKISLRFQGFPCWLMRRRIALCTSKGLTFTFSALSDDFPQQQQQGKKFFSLRYSRRLSHDK